MVPGHITYILPQHHLSFKVEAESVEESIIAFLDELLFYFGTPPYLVARMIYIEKLEKVESTRKWTVEGWLKGETFDRKKHAAGTEVKAITSSNLRVNITPPFDIYVIVDI